MKHSRIFYKIGNKEVSRRAFARYVEQFGDTVDQFEKELIDTEEKTLECHEMNCSISVEA